MRVPIAAAALFALTACQQQTAERSEAPTAVAENGCPASASASWETLQISAHAHGADCAMAQANLTIRSGDQTLWSQDYPVNQVMVLQGAESVEDLQRRLNEWIDPAGAARNSTADLPVWTAGAAHPMSGEFPFYQDEGVDRAAYETLRGRDAPMFCFVQGMESEACLALENGRIRKIGAQSFPG